MCCLTHWIEFNEFNKYRYIVFFFSFDSSLMLIICLAVDVEQMPLFNVIFQKHNFVKHFYKAPDAKQTKTQKICLNERKINMNNNCYSPWPLPTVLPFVNKIWLSSSWSSDLSSASLLLLFFTMDATSDNERRSVVTSRSFSAPSFIYAPRNAIKMRNVNKTKRKRNWHYNQIEHMQHTICVCVCARTSIEFNR